jgi:prephenate dehydratase
MAVKIAIQGFEGSFHQAAAQHFFNEVEVITCSTFREVVKIASHKKQSDGGVMAIENSIAGSILPNYNLLQKSNLKIAGEVYLHIRQHLVANHNVKLEDIKEVHSHPMALLQCIDFLDKHHWKLVETEDTALSAKYVAESKSKNVAAVASKLAAKLYNLNIPAPNIHTLKDNYTRFLVLQREDNHANHHDANKASVNFFTNHSKGSLAKVLTTIADCGINLSKLQSFPIPGSDWKYHFHADMEFDDVDQFHRALEAMVPLTEEVKVYGLYQKGKTFYE